MNKRNTPWQEEDEEAAKVALVQRLQVGEQGSQLSAMSRQADELTDSNQDDSKSIEEIESILADSLQKSGLERPSEASLEDVKHSESLQLNQADHDTVDTKVAQLDFSTTLVRYDSDWSTYLRNVEDYARANGIDLGRASFESLLSARQRSDILRRVETDFGEKCDCDRWDYAIAASCGVLAGLVDAFLVGVPKDRLLGGLSDKAADQLVERFAKMCGWDTADSQGPIEFLEDRFKVNYDHQHGAAVGGKFRMSTGNHHIKSLSHSPSPIGLLFSVLDQFTDHASFVADGSLIRIRTDDRKFELQGSNVPSKLFAAFCNWIGHILSDATGASGTEGRGSGVPIPLFELLQFVNIGSDKRTLAEMAVGMFEEGYDARFGAALAVPVLINELFIRIAWIVKRRYYHGQDWSDCKPSANHPSLRRMLLVGYGSLVLVDSADAVLRGGGQPVAILTRMNFIAWTRFAFLGLREVHRLFNSEAERMRRIDDAIDAEMTVLLADSAFART